MDRTQTLPEGSFDSRYKICEAVRHETLLREDGIILEFGGTNNHLKKVSSSFVSLQSDFETKIPLWDMYSHDKTCNINGRKPPLIST